MSDYPVTHSNKESQKTLGGDVVAVAERAATALGIAQQLKMARQKRDELVGSIEEGQVRRGMELLEFLAVTYDAIEVPAIEASKESLFFRLRQLVHGWGSAPVEVKMIGYGKTRIYDHGKGNLFVGRDGKLWINLSFAYLCLAKYSDVHERIGGCCVDESLAHPTAWKDMIPFDVERHQQFVNWESLCLGLERVCSNMEHVLQKNLKAVEQDIEAKQAVGTQNLWVRP